MESANDNNDVTYHCKFFKIFQDGSVKVHRPMRDRPAQPPTSNKTQFRDVVISQLDNITARIFLPETETEKDKQKLPVLLYIHGGGFCMLSPYANQYHRYCSQLAAEAKTLIVSVDYGLFPDRPIPACYDDSWVALKWLASHSPGSESGPESSDPWISEYADFNRLFIAGDSAGGNISHTLAYRVGLSGLTGVKLIGAAMMHPFFGGTEDDLIWMRMCPTNEGLDDPRMNPSERDLAVLGCDKVLIFVAENDHLFEPGRRYYEKLRRSGWKGKVEMFENFGKEHCFHLFDVEDEQAVEMRRKLVAFVVGE